MINLFENRNRISIILVLIVLSILISHLIVYQNYNLIPVAATIFLGYLIFVSNIIPIVIIFFICFFGNWLAQLEIIPGQINWLTEVIVGLLFLKAISTRIIKREKIHLIGLWVIFPFIIITIVSFIINETDIIIMLLFLRILFRYYLLFLAVINLNLDEKSMKFIINLLIFLFIIQIPVAIIKLFIYGQGESAIGTYAVHGGILSTVIPLIAIGFLFSYYFIHKKSLRYILISIAFIAFSIIGGKRGFIFYLPLVLLFIIWYLKKNIKNILQYALIGGLVLLLAIYAALRLVPELNPEREVGGSFDLKYVKEFFVAYTTQQTKEGTTSGRFSSSLSVFRILSQEGFHNVLLGDGPGKVTESRFSEFNMDWENQITEYGIRYGMTGLSWVALQVGYLGAFIYMLLFYVILKRCSSYFKLETSSYWRSFALGMTGFSFIIIIISLSYHSIFIEDLIPMIYFCLSAFIILKSGSTTQ